MGVTCKEHEGDYRLWCDECHERVRARLAAVEAERDEWKDAAVQEHANSETYRARLAKVEALCDVAIALKGDYTAPFARQVRAAARGEGDRG